jgi:hypothetical protein
MEAKPAKRRRPVMITSRGGRPARGRAKVGRPTKFTPEVQQRILLALRAGSHAVVAARFAGVGESTFHSWMADTRRPYQDFRRACETAIAEWEVALAGTILQGARQSPGAALKILERRHPERWGRARAELVSEAPELGPDPNEPPPPPSDAPLLLTLPPEWTPLWLAMYEAALRGASPDEFLSNPDRSAMPDRLTNLRDEGYGFGRGRPAPEDVDCEPADSGGEHDKTHDAVPDKRSSDGT